MDPNQKILLEAIKKAQAAKDFNEMLLTAQKAFQAYPGDRVFQEYLHTAQAEYVNEKLHAKVLKELEDKKDWEGLVAIYEKLLSIFPESDHLPQLLKKVQKRIEEGHKKERTQYFKGAYKKIETMLVRKQLDDAEQACYEMLALDPNNKHFIHLLAHVQHLQDKEMDRLLTLYFANALPELKADYEANKEDFIRV